MYLRYVLPKQSYCFKQGVGYSSDTLIDRAEPEQKRGRLPDESFVKNFDKTILCFPVKLALAPQMAWAVREMLKKEKIKPRFKQSKIQELPKAKLKEPFWETLF